MKENKNNEVVKYLLENYDIKNTKLWELWILFNSIKFIILTIKIWL